MTESQQQPAAIAVFAAAESCFATAQAIAQQMNLALLDEISATANEQFALLIWVDENGIGLRQTGRKAPNPIVIDFVGGALGFRGKHSPFAKELVANAVGAKAGHTPTVLDATAGLGRDAFILASRGCEVSMLERSPVVALMLGDALARARRDADVASVVAKMRLYEANASDFMASLNPDDYPEVVYLDPMFPERSKSASVKKEMRLLQQLLGADMDTGELFEAALKVATRRVVVKRPRLAPCITELKPHHVVEGKSGRFDIYHTRALD